MYEEERLKTAFQAAALAYDGLALLNAGRVISGLNLSAQDIQLEDEAHERFLSARRAYFDWLSRNAAQRRGPPEGGSDVTDSDST